MKATRIFIALLLVGWTHGAPYPNFFNDGASMASTIITGSSGLYASSTDVDWLFWEGWHTVSGTPQRVVEVATKNFTTGAWTSNVVVGTATLGNDNHGVPSVTRDPGTGCEYVFYGAHNSDLQIAKTTTCDNPATWSASSLSAGTYGEFTFINAFVVSSTLYLFYETTGNGIGQQETIALTTATIGVGGALTWSGTSKHLIDVAGAAQDGWILGGSYVLNGTNIIFGFNYSTSLGTFPTQNEYVVGYDTTTGNLFNIGSSFTVTPASQPVSKATLDSHFEAQASTDAGCPAIVVDANGTHVVYTDNSTGTTFLNYTLNAGSGWSSPHTIYTYANSSDIPTPGMASSISGGLDVYFADAADSPPWTDYADGAGNTWSVSRSAAGSWGVPGLVLEATTYAQIGYVPVQNKPGQMIFQEVSIDGLTIAGNLRGWVYTVGQGFLSRLTIVEAP